MTIYIFVQRIPRCEVTLVICFTGERNIKVLVTSAGVACQMQPRHFPTDLDHLNVRCFSSSYFHNYRLYTSSYQPRPPTSLPQYYTAFLNSINCKDASKNHCHRSWPYVASQLSLRRRRQLTMQHSLWSERCSHYLPRWW